MIPITLTLVVAATLGRTNGRILAGDGTSVSSLLLNETCQEIAATVSAASAVYDIGLSTCIFLVDCVHILTRRVFQHHLTT